MDILRSVAPRCAFLITTRDTTIAVHAATRERVLTVPRLSDLASERLISVFAPGLVLDRPKELKELSSAVGGSPLALTLVAGFLSKPENSEFSDLEATALSQSLDPSMRLSLAGQRIGDAAGKTMSLSDIVGLSIKGIDLDFARLGLADRASDVMASFAAFAAQPADFDRGAAESVANVDGKILSLLIAKNLIERTASGRLSLHRVVSDYCANLPRREGADRHRDYYLKAFSDVMDGASLPDHESDYAQLLHAWDRSEGEAWMTAFRCTWRYASRVGRYGDVVDRQSRLPPQLKTNEVGELLAAVGTAKIQLGDPAAAIVDLRASMQPGHYTGRAQFVERAFNEAKAEVDLGRTDTALSIYKSVIDQAPNDDVLVAATYVNIGRLLADIGHYALAMDYFNAVFKIPGAGPLAKALAVHNQGRTFLDTGRADLAEKKLLQALVLLENHRSSYYNANTTHYLALASAALGNRTAAINHVRSAIVMRAKIGDASGHRKSAELLELLKHGEQPSFMHQDLSDR